MKMKSNFLVVVVLALVVLGLVACDTGPAAEAAEGGEQEVAQLAVPGVAQQAAVAAGEAELPAPEIVNQAPGNVGQAAGAPHANLAAAGSAGELSEAEIAALQYMREEEKLAHDVYQVLFEAWGLPVFSNIAASEQTHTEAVASLLAAYGLEDGAAGNAAGVFNDEKLQSLYDDLVARGRVSVADALLVGAAIEEIDILDLEAWMEQASAPDVAQLFANLRNGSANHLAAFVGNYERQSGSAYAPQYLSQEAYQATLASAGQGGNGYGQAGANGAGQQNGAGNAAGNGAGSTAGGNGPGSGQGAGPAGGQRGNAQQGGQGGQGYRGGRG